MEFRLFRRKFGDRPAAVLYAATLIALSALPACREEPGAPKRDRETNNLNGRIEDFRNAFVEGAAKDDAIGREAAADDATGSIPAEAPAAPGAETATAPLAAAAETVSAPAPRLAPPPAPSPEASAMIETAMLTPPKLGPAPMKQAKTSLVAFQSAPFPYSGTVAGTKAPFINIVSNGRRGHRSYSRVYWENETYNDPRVLLHIPRGFDVKKPAVLVLFFHGHGATLERDVAVRQQLPKQISDSGVNAVLVAPQLAVDARDSSIGKFWQPGGVKRFLDEAAVKLAQMQGDAGAREAFASMPVIVIGYSGGFVPAAWTIANGGLGKRVTGVVLFDALYGEIDKFSRWIDQRAGFFVSAYASSTRGRNLALEQTLSQRRFPVTRKLAPHLAAGNVVFLPTTKAHGSFVTDAWTQQPIEDLLRRVDLDDDSGASAMSEPR